MSEKVVLKVFNTFGFSQFFLACSAINLLPISLLYQQSFGMLIILFYSFAMYYLLSIIFLKKVVFFESCLKVEYPTKFCKRNLVVYYKDIEYVKHIGYSVNGPGGINIKSRYKRSRISIDIRDHKERNALLAIFEEMGISIKGSPINRKILE